MEGYKISSFIGIVLLFLSAILLIVSLATTGWIETKLSVEMDMAEFAKNQGGGNFPSGGNPMPTGFPEMPTGIPKFTFPKGLSGMPTGFPEFTFPQGFSGMPTGFPKFTFPTGFPGANGKNMFNFKIKQSITLNVGLKSACMKMKIEMPANLPVKIPMNMPTTETCGSIGENPGLEKKRFNNAFICLVLALVLNIFTLIAALVKSPCVPAPKKNIIMLVAITLCSLAAFLALVCIIYFDQKIYNDLFKKSMTAGMAELPVGATINSNGQNRGKSFNMAVVAFVFLIIALMANLIEFFLFRKNANGSSGEAHRLTEKQEL